MPTEVLNPKINYPSSTGANEIVGASVMTSFENDAFWTITLEDMDEPFAHFTLFIEGQKLTDFSIDT